MVALEGGRYLFAIGGWGYRFGSGSNIHDAKKDVPKKKKSVLPFRMNRATSPESNENNAMLEKLTSYEIYDVSKQIWKEAGQLNESRRDFAITVDQCSGKIYAFGGTGIDGASSSVEVFNPHTNSWSNLKPMPEAKRWCHAIQVGNLIHIFETGKKTLTYNIDTDTWSTDAPDETFIPKCPHKGKVCAVASFSGGGNVVVYGYPVKEMDGKLADRWMVTNIANHRSKSWMVLPPADEFMYYRMVVANGKLVILTGNSMIAFQVVDDSEDDLSTLASSSNSTSNSGSKIRASSALTSGSEREVEVREKMSQERNTFFFAFHDHVLLHIIYIKIIFPPFATYSAH